MIIISEQSQNEMMQFLIESKEDVLLIRTFDKVREKIYKLCNLFHKNSLLHCNDFLAKKREKKIMTTRNKKIIFWLLIITLFTSYSSKLCKKSFRCHVQTPVFHFWLTLCFTTLINYNFHVIHRKKKNWPEKDLKCAFSWIATPFKLWLKIYWYLVVINIPYFRVHHKKSVQKYMHK